MNRIISHILADKIARRDTELQRAYDLHKARAAKAINDIKEARERLIEAEAGIAQCIDRARQQGCEDIL